jgi:transcriptional regulator with XRE-family HTH domain
MSSLAQRLRYYRKQSGLTQEMVGDALGIRAVNYSKYEAGDRYPREDKMLALAKLFGVSYIGLTEGVENTFCTLLYAHIKSAVLNEVDGFDAFASDVFENSEAFPFIKNCFEKWRGVCREQWGEWCSAYLDAPTLSKLAFLYERLAAFENGEASDFGISEQQSGDMDSIAKLVFCIAVTDYLTATDTDDIISEAEALLDGCAVISPLQYFAVKVFVPYLSYIADAVELTANTFISDFELAFLYGALTPPDEDGALTYTEEPDNE